MVALCGVYKEYILTPQIIAETSTIQSLVASWSLSHRSMVKTEHTKLPMLSFFLFLPWHTPWHLHYVYYTLPNPVWYAFYALVNSSTKKYPILNSIYCKGVTICFEFRSQIKMLAVGLSNEEIVRPHCVLQGSWCLQKSCTRWHCTRKQLTA